MNGTLTSISRNRLSFWDRLRINRQERKLVLAIEAKEERRRTLNTKMNLISRELKLHDELIDAMNKELQELQTRYPLKTNRWPRA